MSIAAADNQPVACDFVQCFLRHVQFLVLEPERGCGQTDNLEVTQTIVNLKQPLACALTKQLILQP